MDWQNVVLSNKCRVRLCLPYEAQYSNLDVHSSRLPLGFFKVRQGKVRQGKQVGG